MAELKKEFETLGFENVITYLNSGNVIFTSDIQDENTITNTIHKKIEEKFKLDIPVFIIEASKLKELLENQPEWWGTVSKEIYDNIIFIIPPTTYEEVHKALGEPKQELEKINVYKNNIFWSYSLKDYRKTNWWAKTANTSISQSITIRTANTMKKVLKGWLIDNSVTTDNKTDKILLLASAGSLTLDDVLEEMYKQDTGLRPETMRHSVTLYHRVVMDLILNGYSVNTGLFRAVPQLKGVVEGGAWNKENNSIYVSFTQDKALREAIAKTVVEILGEKSNIMYILETEDRKTGLKDGSATAGHNFFVRGAMLKVVGDHESVGVTLTDSKGATTKLTDDQITINNPSSLTLLLPADLAEGEYTLTVTTQYGSAGHILKTPRSVSTQIWVGGKPADGGGDSESPDEI